MSLKPEERLYLITGRAICGGDLLDKVTEALSGGVRLIQLREKDLAGKALLELALKLREATKRFGARLLVNDRVDVALLSEADGVHLGQNALPPADARKILGKGRLIGVSTHSVKEALKAEAEGADFITFGPVYHTSSKAKYGEPVGVEALKEARYSVNIPVFALGGVKKENAREVLGAGAYGVAVISAILGSKDAKKSARELIEEINIAW